MWRIVPMPRRSDFGPRSFHLAGSQVVQRCAGSTTWSSTLTIFGISTGTTVSRAAVAVTPSLHPSKSDDPSDYRAAASGRTAGPGRRGLVVHQVALEDPVEARVAVEARRVAGALHGDEPARPQLLGQAVGPRDRSRRVPGRADDDDRRCGGSPDRGRGRVHGRDRPVRT